MRTAILALGLAILPAEAMAIQRYTTTSMSCDEVRSTVRQDGAAILRWQSTRNPNLPRYGRFVRNRAFCRADEVTERAYVPTADRSQCPVSECRQLDLDDEFPLIRRR